MATKLDGSPPHGTHDHDAVVVDGLSKRFGPRTVVDRISFSVPAGSVCGLVGPNGAGKTTIMGMLLGLVRPTEGRAWVLGSRIEDRSAYLRRVGALIEGPAFHPAASAQANLRALAVLARLPTARIGNLIDTVGLTGRGDDRYGSYSLGMKQRLGIAAALLGDPELVVLDEPTNGLDPVGMQDVRELIGRINRGGRTVIVSSHLLSELEAVCDWLIVVDRGRLVHAGPTSTLGAARSVLVLRAGSADQDRLAEIVVRGGHRLAGGRPAADASGGAVRIMVAPDADPVAIARDLNARSHAAGLVLYELHHERADLAARYLELVHVGAAS